MSECFAEMEFALSESYATFLDRAILSIKSSSSRVVISVVLRTIPMHDWRLSLRRTVAPRVTGVSGLCNPPRSKVS